MNDNKEAKNEKAKVVTEADEKITISLPYTLSGEEEARLQALVDSKHSLLTKALETDDLPILVKDETISFPWFTNHDIEGEADAYAQLITAMIKMAKEQKRIVAKDKQEENEKFAMRIFTVRLGLKGEEYKLIRKLLTHNLSGNSAWKNGKPKKSDESKVTETKPEADEKPAKKAPLALPAESSVKAPEKANKAAEKPKKTGKAATDKKAAKAVDKNTPNKKEENTNE